MSPQEARALAMAYELHRILGDLHDLPDNGCGSCVEAAWDAVDIVIAMLEVEPLGVGLDVTPVCRLRLVHS